MKRARKTLPGPGPIPEPAKSKGDTQTSYYLTGELVVATAIAPPVDGEGTINTPDRVVDSNGNTTTKTMVTLEINGKLTIKYLDAEECALILMVLGVMPNAEF